MIPTSETPTDITLEKSSTGTWNVPIARRLRFKPWQRLWFVSGIMYLLMLAGTFHLLVPDHESIERRMVLSVTEEVHRYDGMAFAGESPRTLFERARSLGYHAWIQQVRSTYRIGAEGDAGFDRIEKKYQEALSDLPTQQIIGILICSIAWLVPMSVFYAIGFVLEWIKRGTRGLQG